MKHLIPFSLLNEAIIDWETDNIKAFYDEAMAALASKVSLTRKELADIGERHDVEVVDYATFYKELPSDQHKKTAPPKGIPFFALVNEVTRKVRIVMHAPSANEDDMNFIYHMAKHENVHIGQLKATSAKGHERELGGMDVTDMNKYFSDKDEVMAFSQSVVDMIMSKSPRDYTHAMSILPGIRLWQDIKRLVKNPETLKRYKKYIYLYLEKEFGKRNP